MEARGAHYFEVLYRNEFPVYNIFFKVLRFLYISTIDAIALLFNIILINIILFNRVFFYVFIVKFS